MEEVTMEVSSSASASNNAQALLAPSSADVLLVSEKKAKRVDDPQDLVELAKSIDMAREFVKASATSKLCVIVDQIRTLQEQAKFVLKKAKSDEDLHNVACNLKKIAGSKYYLYKKRDGGQRYFSMISPEEWGIQHAEKNEFLGCYRYEADRSWTCEADCAARDKEMGMLEGILAQQKQFRAITD
uniref:Coil containing protein n=1 Tax=Steinernema glaseri TaxID=37863 RepID=A0A1I8AQN0_9BILA